MAREFIESRRNSYRRSSQRSSSQGPPPNGGYSNAPQMRGGQNYHSNPGTPGGYPEDMQYDQNGQFARPYPNSNYYQDPPPSRGNGGPRGNSYQYQQDMRGSNGNPNQYPEQRGGDNYPNQRNSRPPSYKNPGNSREREDYIPQGAPRGAEDRRIPVVLPPYEAPPRYEPASFRGAQNSLYLPEEDHYQFMPRRVVLQKRANQPFGFHIRGGADLSCGIYVSVVLPGSLAERCGLRIKDHIWRVNGVDFESKITHREAVGILRSSDKLELTVRFFPAGYNNSLLYEKSPDTSRTWIAT